MRKPSVFIRKPALKKPYFSRHRHAFVVTVAAAAVLAVLFSLLSIGAFALEDVDTTGQ